MHANSQLIEQIKELRDNVRKRREDFKSLGGDKLLTQIMLREAQREKQIEALADYSSKQHTFENEAPDVQKRVAVQRQHINQLELRLEGLQQTQAQMRHELNNGYQM